VDRRIHFRVHECRRCGLARTEPAPDPEQYESGYRPTTESGHFSGALTDAYSEHLAAWVRARSAGTALLDVGCHVGNLVDAAARVGFASKGVDRDPIAVRAGQAAGRPITKEALDGLTDEYDVVVANHVLEHVADPRSFLVQLERVTAEHGRVFIFVPHY